ncbi:class III extradiol dioxygenase family protein [Novosphingobium pokkalii]|jgi:protocatechuate 4,5-dioxygenase beta chain|uniref:Class III extradiol dioxygenase family protein n=1 Tax=Novosphingobium pokkalii TaxID=1770194 RepID=A0ABV7V3W8_9SPHN|nr:class III extradiol dioxygenase family protein [Novosphingobium pokkalii]GHC94135.1 protocatechuate 4,5-dioxygenase subunit beta [Novosphingobium pokkalii]
MSAQIIGGYFSSHVPGIGGAIARGDQSQPYWKPFFDGYPPVRQWLAQARPDVAIVFYNDHGLNFFLDAMPTFAVGAAADYPNEDEGWGLPVYKTFQGDPALSWHIIEELVGSGFDVTMCQKMKVDHALSIPFELAYPDVAAWPVKIVPIAINTVQYPLPSPQRCYDLGRAVHRALQSWQDDTRVVVIGSGGLSHQLDGSRAGFINADYDRFCLDHLANEPEALLRHSTEEVAAIAGTQGVEIVNWIAARGALGQGPQAEVTRNYHIPISNTAAATLVLAPA